MTQIEQLLKYQEEDSKLLKIEKKLPVQASGKIILRRKVF